MDAINQYKARFARAEQMADAIRDGFGGRGGSVDVLSVYGWAYLLTRGTGDGNYVYDASDVTIPEAGPGWYQRFCDANYPEEDERIAVAAYMAHGVAVHCNGGATTVLTDDQIRALAIAVEVAP